MFITNLINVTHKKTNNKYRIIGFVKNCTNANDGQIMVIYEHLTTHGNVHYTRELNEFKEKFDCPNLDEQVSKFIEGLPVK